MKQALLKIIQQALNRYIKLDPESPKRLEKLATKRIEITLNGMNVSFQMSFEQQHIQLIDDGISADTYIKGTPLSLLRMTLANGDRKRFFAEDVLIEGDLDVGQEVINLFDQLEIDWEELLSHYTGDIAAHQVGRVFRKIKINTKRTIDLFLQNINEYVHEEKEWFPTKEIMKDFFTEVDELRMDVDRISARIELLKKVEAQ